MGFGMADSAGGRVGALGAGAKPMPGRPTDKAPLNFCVMPPPRAPEAYTPRLGEGQGNFTPTSRSSRSGAPAEPTHPPCSESGDDARDGLSEKALYSA